MPQQFTLYPDLTARENVDFVASLFGILWRTRHRRTREVAPARRPVGRPRPPGRPPVGRHAAPPRARLRPRPRPVPAVPRRADRGHRPDPARHGLGGAASPARRRPDAARDDPVRQRGGGVRHGRARSPAAGSSRSATPEELRREADGRRHRRDRDDRRLRRARPADPADGPRRRAARVRRALRVRVDDAATAMPDVVEAIDQRGGEVVSAQEAPAVVRRGLRDPRRARPASRAAPRPTTARPPDARRCSPWSSG